MVRDPDPVLRALADPTRRAIFESLIKSESHVTDLTARMKVSQPAVSQHLGVLRDAGLVTQRQDGRQRFYRADPQGLSPLFDWLEHYRRFWPRKLSKLKTLLETLE